MKAIFDTSTLQALWRGGVLENVPALYEESAVPPSVVDETVWSLARIGRKPVPDITGLPWLKSHPVRDQRLRESMVRLFEAHALPGEAAEDGPIPRADDSFRGGQVPRLDQARQIPGDETP